MGYGFTPNGSYGEDVFVALFDDAYWLSYFYEADTIFPVVGYDDEGVLMVYLSYSSYGFVSSDIHGYSWW